VDSGSMNPPSHLGANAYAPLPPSSPTPTPLPLSLHLLSQLSTSRASSNQKVPPQNLDPVTTIRETLLHLRARSINIFYSL